MLKNGVWDEGMSRGCTEAVLRQGIATHLASDQYRIVPGWFKDTAPVFAASDRLYSLVHADCDLYQSTVDALAPLFAKRCLSPGCIVLMDDWNGNHAAREYGQRKAWAYLAEIYGIDYSDEGAYDAYSHKFIVHSYREAS